MKLTKNFWISFAVALVLFGWLQYESRGVFADPDGFYHAKASQLLAAGKLQDSFPWLYYTTWNQGYADQHYLYHWLLVPFNTIDKLPISVMVFSMAFIVMFLLVLRKYKIGYEIFWTILLLGSSSDFLFRVNLVKANTISLALLCVIALLVYDYTKNDQLSRKFFSIIGFGFVSAVFVWTYGGFVCVPLLLIAYACAYLIYKIALERNWGSIKSIGFNFLYAILPVIASVIGIIVGMYAHPHSNHIFNFLYNQLFLTGLGAGINVPAGNEWNPFNLTWFIQSNILLLIAWSFGVGVLVHQTVKIIKNKFSSLHEKDYFILIIWMHFNAFGLMILTLWHRRFVEYWVPFAVLAAAISIYPYFRNIKFLDLKEALRFWQMKVSVVAVLLVTIITIQYNINYTKNSLANSDEVNVFQAPGLWLIDHSLAGDIVFNTQWDQFPQLFYYDDQNYYIIGLDPTFMYIKNMALYWQWRKVSDDKLAGWKSVQEVHDLLADKFHAKYLVLDRNKNAELYDYLTSTAAEGLFTNGFVNQNVAILTVN